MKSNSTFVYKYELSGDRVMEVIERVLAPGKSLLGNLDLSGRITGNDSFVIHSGNAFGTHGVGYSSVLYAEVIRKNEQSTEVKTHTRAGLGVYLLFGFSVVAGLAYLYQFIVTRSTVMLLWGLALLFVGPALSYFIAKVSNAGIRERYMLYIDKELRKSTIHK